MPGLIIPGGDFIHMAMEVTERLKKPLSADAQY
jgi:hypothetical protein